MIALDTNILVRYFLSGDDGETGRAARLIESELSAETQGFVSAITLCEIVWVLRNRYRFGKDAVAAVIRLMLESVQLNLEHDDCAIAALDCGHADIADAIIHFVGAKHGCTGTVTFDRKFARLEGVELLKD